MATNGSRDVTERAKETISQVQGRMNEGLEDFRGYLDTADGAVRDFAREKPLLAIACAVGLGFIIGRIASRA
jgi:ElaB/YqjD/DUF883 family membrane-anchored ribosome-binding protein